MASATKKANKSNKASVGSVAKKTNTAVRIVVTVVAIIFIVFSLFGFINQRKAANNIIDFYRNAGEEAYDVVTDLFNNDNEAIDLTDNGVYLKGHAPDGSKYVTGDEAGENAPTENTSETAVTSGSN